jgi:hypothetical protein
VLLVIDGASNPALRPRVEKSLSDSGLRADLVLEETPEHQGDYVVTLKFDFRHIPLVDFENIWQMADLFLLTMYPATCNRYRFTLNARVEDRSKTPIKTYSLQDIDTAWVWLLVGPTCELPENTDDPSVGDKAEHLLKELYRRMARDDVFDPARAAALGAARGPLVYVSANRAQDLIEDGFLLDDSQLRYSFDPADAAAADYTLKLDLSFSGQTFMGGRAYLAIMTAGLVPVCPLHAATLEGSAFDRAGSLLNHYRAVSHWQPAFTTNCVLEDENGRPDMVRQMARELAQDVTPASLIAGARATSWGGAPLVKIVTNADRPVVERVTSERKPFERVTLEDTAAAAPDYFLNLEFTTSGGGSRIGPDASMAKAIAFGFAFGLTLNSRMLCKPTSYLLVARLTDASGTPIAYYDSLKTAGTTTIGCSVGPEPDPDIAEDLVEQLYAKMAKDASLPPALRASSGKHR